MKRWTTLLIVICMLGITIPAMGAMSISKMRQNTRFLTDRMAYELKLTPQQYNDVYEVNYDFINNVRYLMDDVVRGYDYALERYYDFLDVRNDDLRWILSSAQYRRFMRAEHFYRPIYAHENKWQFRIYLVYNNVNFFYYGKPHHYASYCGGHYRTHFNNVSYYKIHYRDHYRHDVYDGHYRIRHDRMTYDMHRRRDFNIVVRPPQRIIIAQPLLLRLVQKDFKSVLTGRRVIIIVCLFHRQGRTDRRRIIITSMMGALHDVDRTHRLIRTVMKIGVLLHPAGM